jgi:hypothetical protein
MHRYLVAPLAVPRRPTPRGAAAADRREAPRPRQGGRMRHSKRRSSHIHYLLSKSLGYCTACRAPAPLHQLLPRCSPLDAPRHTGAQVPPGAGAARALPGPVEARVRGPCCGYLLRLLFRDIAGALGVAVPVGLPPSKAVAQKRPSSRPHLSFKKQRLSDLTASKAALGRRDHGNNL